jgi:hypothetical protein
MIVHGFPDEVERVLVLGLQVLNLASQLLLAR